MKFILVFAFLGLSSCVAQAPYQRQVLFDEAEYKPYGVAGTGSISGQAFLKTRAGDVKYGAGNEVWLNPVTTYSTEWFENAVVPYRSITPPDRRTSDYARRTIADAEGRFKFEKLPPGEYYAVCSIIWQYPGGYQGSLVSTGSMAYAKVRVGDGEQVANVVVTRR